MKGSIYFSGANSLNATKSFLTLVYATKIIQFSCELMIKLYPVNTYVFRYFYYGKTIGKERCNQLKMTMLPQITETKRSHKNQPYPFPW